VDGLNEIYLYSFHGYENEFERTRRTVFMHRLFCLMPSVWC
jgi:hypothetical protein